MSRKLLDKSRVQERESWAEDLEIVRKLVFKTMRQNMTLKGSTCRYRKKGICFFANLQHQESRE